MPTQNRYVLTFATPEPIEPEVRALLKESLADTVRDVLGATVDDLAVAIDQEVVA